MTRAKFGNLNLILGLWGVLSLSAAWGPLAYASPGCENLFGAGVNPVRQPEGHIRFGFESEYTLHESTPLLEVYGPHPRFGVTQEHWLRMTAPERLSWVRAHIARVPEFGEASGLVRYVREPGFHFLPDSLILDSTGNLEIVLPPVETYRAWKDQVLAINARFGVGSQQAMVSSPSLPYFRKGLTGAAQILDFLALIHEFDTLTKLQTGAERYARDSTKPSALSFLHPFLGPMTASKRTQLLKYVLKNVQGEFLNDEAMEWVRKSDASFKYIGGTVYRPDIGHFARLAFEVRDAHKNFELLDSHVRRLVEFFQTSENTYAGASQMGAFDPLTTFSKLPLRLKSVLKALAPAALKPGTEYSAEEIDALQVYRNFSYPLRDWQGVLRFLKRPELASQISGAQTRYLARLEGLAEDVQARRLSTSEALLKLQGALSTFAIESGLPQAFQTWKENLPPPGEIQNPDAA